MRTVFLLEQKWDFKRNYERKLWMCETPCHCHTKVAHHWGRLTYTDRALNAKLPRRGGWCSKILRWLGDNHMAACNGVVVYIYIYTILVYWTYIYIPRAMALYILKRFVYTLHWTYIKFVSCQPASTMVICAVDNIRLSK